MNEFRAGVGESAEPRPATVEAAGVSANLPCYFLRRADGLGYVLSNDGETFTTVPLRHLASAFCAHHASELSRWLYEQTGVRHRMVFAGYLAELHPAP